MKYKVQITRYMLQLKVFDFQGNLDKGKNKWTVERTDKFNKRIYS